MSVQLVALLANIALAVLKFVVGVVANSRALIADAFNSAGDVVATFVGWVAFRIGRTPPDDDHHYGHENAEALAGLLIGAVICATGVFIVLEAVLGWVDERDRSPPDIPAAWAAVATAVIKEALYRASIRVGRRTGSPTLLATARDHRADVGASLVALLGILTARSGWPWLDDLAGAAIGAYMLVLGVEPVRDNVRILMAGASPELAAKAAASAGSVDGLREVGDVKVLPMGGRFQVDMTIRVDGDHTVARGHDIAHDAEAAILAAMPEVTEVRVHVEPVSR